MLLILKDNEGAIVVKDMLDINFDMSISSEKQEFYVNINSIYKLNEIFHSENDAVERMIFIAECRNNLEDELRNM